MERHALNELVCKGLTQREIAVELACSQSTVRYWLNRFGFKTQQARNSKRFCRRCGETDSAKLRKGCRYICKQCDAQRVVERLRQYKGDAVEYKGGKCEVCGYDKCHAALDFHHVDPSKKDPDWQRNKNSRTLERIKTELDKCMLVCKNCHAEIHYQAGVA